MHNFSNEVQYTVLQSKLQLYTVRKIQHPIPIITKSDSFQDPKRTDDKI